MKISAMERFEFIDFNLDSRIGHLEGKIKIAYVPPTKSKGRYTITLNKELTNTIRERNAIFARLRRDSETGDLFLFFQQEWTKDSTPVSLSKASNGIINNKGLVLAIARLIGIPLNQLNGYLLNVSSNKSRNPDVVNVLMSTDQTSQMI